MNKKSIHSNPDEFQAILRLLKLHLKEKQISYRELAERIGLSESGLKKIFTSEDCSFSRLNQIAGCLGLRMSDILNQIDEHELKSVSFSAEQQEYFLNNPAVFRFFFKLVIERLPLREIQENYSVDDNLAKEFLMKLHEFRLIRLLPDMQIKLPPLALVRDFGSGPLMQQIYQEWGVDLVKTVADPEHQATGQFMVRCLRMKDETFHEFLSRLQEVEREFLRRSIREMSAADAALRPMRWISMTDQSSHIRQVI